MKQIIFFKHFLSKIILRWDSIVRFSILIIATIYLSNWLYGPIFSYLNEKVQDNFYSYESCYSSNGLTATTNKVNFSSEINSPKNILLKSILDEKVKNYNIDGTINFMPLLNYGFFIKDTTDITKWHIKATEPKDTVVPVILEAKMDGEKFKFSYEQEERVTKKPFGYEKLFNQHQVDIAEITIKPMDDNALKGILVGPNEKIEIENLNHENNPISLQDATERSGSKCLFVFYIKPINLTLGLKLTILLVNFLLISFLILKILFGLVSIYKFIIYGKINN